MIKIAVSASRKYNVIMDRGALGRAGELFADAGISGGRKLCIVTDRNVAPLYGTEDGELWRSLADAGFELYRFVFEGGEKSKTHRTRMAGILNLPGRQPIFTRSDMLVALGGGIVGDVTGFRRRVVPSEASDGSRYRRRCWPSVDSSVGGKTGVNLDAGKNLAGAFWQPSLVVFDPYVLGYACRTTPRLDGIAEAVKAGFIGDRSHRRRDTAHGGGQKLHSGSCAAIS